MFGVGLTELLLLIVIGLMILVVFGFRGVLVILTLIALITMSRKAPTDDSKQKEKDQTRSNEIMRFDASDRAVPSFHVMRLM